MLHAKSIALNLEYYENASYIQHPPRAQAEAPYRPVRVVSELAQLGQSSISLAGVTLASLYLQLAPGRCPPPGRSASRLRPAEIPHQALCLAEGRHRSRAPGLLPALALGKLGPCQRAPPIRPGRPSQEHLP